MHKLSEELLHFIWKHKLLKPGDLRTVSGKPIKILHVGDHNFHAGPDFFNAKIEIEGIVLAGNLEIHTKSSDWRRHGHASDEAYDQLALHVVYEHDEEVLQNTRHAVEVLELKSYIDESTLEHYQSIERNAAVIPCGQQLHRIETFRFYSWVERMAIERLESKVVVLEALFQNSNHDYSTTFYRWLMRAFGLPVNKVPFEMLATSLPLSLLLRYSNDLLRVECLLLGVAGLLEEETMDKRKLSLINEFSFLSAKHGLVPLSAGIFKFSRMRPPDFPDKRLAQMARLMTMHTDMVTHPHTINDKQTIQRSLQNIGAGEGFINRLIVNAYVPWLFFYGKRLMREDIQRAAIQILESCAAENNAKTRCFTGMQSHVKSALQSQGLLHLYDQYCTRKRCLYCGIAASLLRPAPKASHQKKDS